MDCFGRCALDRWFWGDGFGGGIVDGCFCGFGLFANVFNVEYRFGNRFAVFWVEEVFVDAAFFHLGAFFIDWMYD